MNRRDFIKAAGASTALATWTVTCKYDEPEQDPKGDEGKTGSTGVRWDYVVCCHERSQGQWVFTENTEGSFAYQREYLDIDDEREFGDVFSGWMDQGKLHFSSFEEAKDFIEAHVKTREGSDIVDSIYDIYYLDFDNLEYDTAQPEEIHVANYWYNKEAGRSIKWKNKKYA